MMSRNLMRFTRQERLKSFVRVGALTLATLLLVALAPPTQAQIFNQEVSRALGGGCEAMEDPSGNLNTIGKLDGICTQGPPVSAAASSGSTTTLSRESSPVVERKVQRLIGPINLFISGGYEAFDKDVTKFEPGYNTDTWRATIGADYSFNERFVAGGAFNYTNDNGNFKSGGRFDTDSYGGLLYANFVPAPKSFIDATAGYTGKNYSLSRVVSLTTEGNDGTTSTTTLGTTASDTDGNDFQVGVNSGYDFNFKNITIGPRLGLNYKHTEIDGYRERGDTGLELVYATQNENSLTSILGMYGSVAISTGFGVLVPQTTLEYVHEFEDPQRRINFRFVDDENRTRFRFENDPPDRNYFNLGLGIVAVLPHGFSPFVNYRALVGYKDQSSHIVTAGLRIEF